MQQQPNRHLLEQNLTSPSDIRAGVKLTITFRQNDGRVCVCIRPLIPFSWDVVVCFFSRFFAFSTALSATDLHKHSTLRSHTITEQTSFFARWRSSAAQFLCLRRGTNIIVVQLCNPPSLPDSRTDSWARAWLGVKRRLSVEVAAGGVRFIIIFYRCANTPTRTEHTRRTGGDLFTSHTRLITNPRCRFPVGSFGIHNTSLLLLLLLLLCWLARLLDMCAVLQPWMRYHLVTEAALPATDKFSGLLADFSTSALPYLRKENEMVSCASRWVCMCSMAHEMSLKKRHTSPSARTAL